MEKIDDGIRRNGKLQSADSYLSRGDERESPDEPARSQASKRSTAMEMRGRQDEDRFVSEKEGKKKKKRNRLRAEDAAMSYRDEQEDPQRDVNT